MFALIRKKKMTRKPIISIIAAVAAGNRAIGRNNQLLFELPEDLAHFKKITHGHPVIMGYKTYQSLPFLLPGRLNIILTPDDIKIEGAAVAHSLEEAYDIASQSDQEEIFVIGGGYVYSQAIKDADRLYLTVVDAEVTDADTFFPEYENEFHSIEAVASESGGYKISYVVLER